MIDIQEINKKLEKRGYYFKTLKVWNSDDYNYLITEALKIKQLYKDSWEVKIMQIESCGKVMSVNLEISEGMK